MKNRRYFELLQLFKKKLRGLLVLHLFETMGNCSRNRLIDFLEEEGKKKKISTGKPVNIFADDLEIAAGSSGISSRRSFTPRGDEE